jgi:hypothetical protein
MSADVGSNTNMLRANSAGGQEYDPTADSKECNHGVEEHSEGKLGRQGQMSPDVARPGRRRNITDKGDIAGRRRNVSPGRWRPALQCGPPVQNARRRRLGQSRLPCPVETTDPTTKRVTSHRVTPLFRSTEVGQSGMWGGWGCATPHPWRTTDEGVAKGVNLTTL